MAASLNHPALVTNITQAHGAGYRQGRQVLRTRKLVQGGVQQMLFTTWLYDTQHDIMGPRIPKNANQEDLIRLQRFYDMAPEYPK